MNIICATNVNEAFITSAYCIFSNANPKTPPKVNVNGSVYFKLVIIVSTSTILVPVPSRAFVLLLLLCYAWSHETHLILAAAPSRYFGPFSPIHHIHIETCVCIVIVFPQHNATPPDVYNALDTSSLCSISSQTGYM